MSKYSGVSNSEFTGFEKMILAVSLLSQSKGGGRGWITLVLDPEFWNDIELRSAIRQKVQTIIKDFDWASAFLSIPNRTDPKFDEPSYSYAAKLLNMLKEFGQLETIVRDTYVDFDSSTRNSIEQLFGPFEKGNKSDRIEELVFASTIHIYPRGDFAVNVKQGIENIDHVRRIIKSEYQKALELVKGPFFSLDDLVGVE